MRALGLQPVPEGCRIEGTGAESAGELKRLFVLPEFRRFGVGRALMLRAEAEARRPRLRQPACSPPAPR